jgi:hypothetical protein
MLLPNDTGYCNGVNKAAHAMVAVILIKDPLATFLVSKA